MRENEIRAGTKLEQKDKIRKRYRKAENADVTVIPAKPQKHPFDTEQECRVAVYARVSTDSPDQTSSYELQKNYYENMIQRNPNW
ncbi:MAG: recombinase family protein, partial [Lachnospiraceae bacterium]|nr:recombinase family protein [Lachnospiraceae bacterium]